MNRSSWYRRDVLWHAAVVAAPVLAFTSLILWFWHNPISPEPSVEASLANPAGFLTSNFVYDGYINIENIVASSAFVLLVCAYYPRDLRPLLACLLPFAAVGASALAELTTASTSYINLPFCSGSCSFYGMSGVASGMIGFAVASFLIALGIFALRRSGRVQPRDGNAIFGNGRTGLVVLLSAFVVYVVLLLFFSGLVALPAATSGGHSSGGVSPSPPPAILTQTPPVALVHSASLTYGFLLCLVVLVRVNRRYRILVLPARG